MIKRGNIKGHRKPGGSSFEARRTFLKFRREADCSDAKRDIRILKAALAK